MAVAPDCGSRGVLPWLLEIALPEVNVDAASTVRRAAPQDVGVEPHTVKGLRRGPLTSRVGIRQRLDAVHAVDRAALAAHVSRHPSVAGRMHVADDDGIAGLEACARRVDWRWQLRGQTRLDDLGGHGRLVAAGLG